MSQLYSPFAGRDLATLRAALERPLRSLEDLSQLRRALGRQGLGAAMKRVVAQERDFAALFAARIGPAFRDAALRLVDRAPTLLLHQPGIAARTSIARAEVPGWIAHILLGTLTQPAGDHPHLDGSLLFERGDPATAARLRSMLALFDRIADEPLRGELVIERVVVPPRSAAEWASDPSPLAPLFVDGDGLIEEFDRHLQADFANAYLGGGVLSGGAVQEEIRFSVSPELLFGMVISPRMIGGEAIRLRGSEQFSRTHGYAGTLTFGGALRDPAPRLADGTPDTVVVAMDAIHFSRLETSKQFSEPLVLREANEARAAFARDAASWPVATGNWGCGAFNGDPQLKAVIQWLAASAEGRAIRYCTFGDPRIAELAHFVAIASARFDSVGALWRGLIQAAAEQDYGLFELLAKNSRGSAS